MIISDSQTPFLRSTLINQSLFSHGFSTKAFGDGRIEQDSLRIDIRPQQTHGTDILVVQSEEDKVPTEICDGIITTLSGLTISVLSADCVPIMYVDPVSQIVGLSHQGWKGTLNVFPEKMIAEMEHLGATVSDIIAIFGPAINACCYEVYGERKYWYESLFQENVFSKQDDKTYVSLYKANRETLINAGVSAENIDIFPFCTSCDRDRFYSYQRDCGIEGEMIAFVSII